MRLVAEGDRGRVLFEVVEGLFIVVAGFTIELDDGFLSKVVVGVEVVGLVVEERVLGFEEPTDF